MNTNLFNILWFSCQGKSRDIIYQSSCLFSWWIFVQHGLFGILLTAYSALSRLTDYGIYSITRCGLSMLTIFHFPDIHLQRELRNVTPPKLYLSFFSVYDPICNYVLYLLGFLKMLRLTKWLRCNVNRGGGGQFSTLKFAPIYNYFHKLSWFRRKF